MLKCGVGFHLLCDGLVDCGVASVETEAGFLGGLRLELLCLFETWLRVVLAHSLETEFRVFFVRDLTALSLLEA